MTSVVLRRVRNCLSIIIIIFFIIIYYLLFIIIFIILLLLLLLLLPGARAKPAKKKWNRRGLTLSRKR